jgi:hypothetical protein
MPVRGETGNIESLNLYVYLIGKFSYPVRWYEAPLGSSQIPEWEQLVLVPPSRFLCSRQNSFRRE